MNVTLKIRRFLNEYEKSREKEIEFFNKCKKFVTSAKSSVIINSVVWLTAMQT